MGGPFRAIVGGADQNMSFPPAQAIQLDNYSDQYGHLILSDVFVAPGQIGMVVLVDGITSDKFRFEGPPGAIAASPTAGQICLVRTYDVAEAGAPSPPLQPGVGVLLPIGLDVPQHHHPHTHGAHLHTHTATHTHTSDPHVHGHSATHVHAEGSHSHPLNIQAGAAIVTAVGLDAGGQLVAAAGPQPIGTVTDATNLGNTGATSPGNTDSTTPAPTGATAPGSTNNTTPTSDATVEDVRHTHP